VISQPGFTAIDDLAHGFGGGYLPPVVPRTGPGGRSDRRTPPVTMNRMSHCRHWRS
jgi:hypothetical protein